MKEPIVQGGCQLQAYIFLDCDGNKLEFISMLHDNQMN